jgi:hypothetical protein
VLTGGAEPAGRAGPTGDAGRWCRANGRCAAAGAQREVRRRTQREGRGPGRRGTAGGAPLSEAGGADKNLAAAVEDWYKFAKNAYSATDEEFFRDEEEVLEMPVTAEPITDDRILRHARTVKVGNIKTL